MQMISDFYCNFISLGFTYYLVLDWCCCLFIKNQTYYGIKKTLTLLPVSCKLVCSRPGRPFCRRRHVIRPMSDVGRVPRSPRSIRVSQRVPDDVKASCAPGLVANQLVSCCWRCVLYVGNAERRLVRAASAVCTDKAFRTCNTPVYLSENVAYVETRSLNYVLRHSAGATRKSAIILIERPAYFKNLYLDVVGIQLLKRDLFILI